MKTMRLPLVAALSATLLAACGGQPARDTSPSATAAAANLQLGAAYLQKGDLAVAKEKLERAASQAPRDAQVRGLLALLYSRMGQDARAEEAYRDALRLAPSDPEQLNNYAVFLCARGRADEGVKRFEQAAANPLYRTPWAAHANAGTCLRDAQRGAEATARYERALAVRPDYAEALVQLADMDLAAGRGAEALARVQAWLGRNAATADVLLVGWRAAGLQQDKLSLAQYAWRLQNEFGGSEQARAVAAGATRTAP